MSRLMDRGKLEHYVDCVLVTSQQQGSPSKVDEALADANGDQDGFGRHGG